MTDKRHVVFVSGRESSRFLAEIPLEGLVADERVEKFLIPNSIDKAVAALNDGFAGCTLILDPTDLKGDFNCLYDAAEERSTKVIINAGYDPFSLPGFILDGLQRGARYVRRESVHFASPDSFYNAFLQEAA